MSLLFLACKDDTPTQPQPSITIGPPQAIGNGWGQHRPRPFQPTKVAVSGDNIYVTNGASNTISVFDTDGTLLREVAPGLSQFHRSIDVQGQSVLVTSSFHDHVIQVFEDTGGAPTVSEWTVEPNLISATWVGDRVFALFGRKGVLVVEIYDRTGTLLDTWLPGTPTPASPASNAHDIAPGKDGGVTILSLSGLRWYDKDLQLVAELEVTGISDISFPHHPFLSDEEYTVFVSEYSTGQVHHLSSSGTRLQTWGDSDPARSSLTVINGAALLSNGNAVAIDRLIHRLVIFDETAGTPTVHQSPSQPHVFSLINNVAISPAGDVFVMDWHHHNVQVFSSSGQYKFTFGGGGREEGQLIAPNTMVFTPAGHVLISDRDHVHTFDSDGNFLSRWSIATAFRGMELIESERLLVMQRDEIMVCDMEGRELFPPTQILGFPSHLLFDPKGNLVYVIARDQVGVYEPTDTQFSSFRMLRQWTIPGITFLEEAALDGEGRLLVATGPWLFAFDTFGKQLLDTPVRWDGEFREVSSIALDPSGSLWFSAQGGESPLIQPFSPLSSNQP